MKFTGFYMNPAPVKKKRRASGKSGGKNKSRNKPGKGPIMAVRKKTRRRKSTTRRRKNPTAVIHVPGRKRARRARIYNLNGARRRSYRRRYRRNPEGGAIAVSLNPLKVDNAIKYGMGVAAGVLAPSVITNMLGFQGNSRYLTQAGIGVAGYIAASKLGQPKAGLAFMITAFAVAMYEFSQDYGIMQGTHQLLGVPFIPPTMGIVPSRMRGGMVPRLHGSPGLGMIVSNNQQAQVNEAGVSGGFDKGIY